ncbi:hypothetical protein [Alicyclobacillus macrosporangiidus]|uniref:Peptide/nickel transport system substrate-binding protein n=1 Tax=Alicyclobacillus macrosporangiidus TaxID=392015 RepID=A0A1I7LI68_9BACL|nr:hypothetical protein [Alicyclobacillus macrosporangiidus]SFV09344.1 peptide/nickel transport system substrate-binding protein [Alicyclobacillus macrosporangiidus]
MNPKVDQLWEQANNETNADKRMNLYKQMQQIITTDAPWVYLYEYNRVVVMNKNVQGYVFYPDEVIRFYGMSKGQ